MTNGKRLTGVVEIGSRRLDTNCIAVLRHRLKFAEQAEVLVSCVTGQMDLTEFDMYGKCVYQDLTRQLL
jgi:hypothetical protein